MKIEDVLHLYIGQMVEYGYQGSKSTGRLIGKVEPFGWQVDRLRVIAPHVNVRSQLLRLRVRRLSDITEDDAWGLVRTRSDLYVVIRDIKPFSHELRFEFQYKSSARWRRGNQHYKDLSPVQFLYLLSKGFWLFGDEAFDEGLIIDAAKH